MKKIFTFISAIFLLSGCSESAPSCSDSEVKQLAIEIVQGEIVKSYVNNPMKYIYDESFQKFSKELEANKEFDDMSKLKQSMEFVNNLAEEMVEDLELSSVRTSNVDDELLKSECEGSFSLPNSKSISVVYDAQTTDNGDLYVNVYGL